MQQQTTTQKNFMYLPQMTAPAAPQQMTAPTQQQMPAQGVTGSFMQPNLFQNQSGNPYAMNAVQPQQPAFQLAQQQVPGTPSSVCITIFTPL